MRGGDSNRKKQQYSKNIHISLYSSLETLANANKSLYPVLSSNEVRMLRL